jgi:hypothetical protein
MVQPIYLLSSDSPTASDQAFSKLVQFLGLRSEFVTVRGNSACPPEALLTHAPDGWVLALDCTTLRQVFQRDWFASVLAETRFVLVYGFAPAEDELPELKWLTGGEISTVTAISAESKQFTIAEDVKFGGFPVSGKSYSVESVPAAVFSAVVPGASIEPYISVNGHPHFVCRTRGHSALFLLAESELVDIEQVLSPELSLRRWYAQLIAITIFLRSAFGDWCWTAPVTGATLVVDDPYLKRRYGFLRYETLVQELERTQGALTIAFIPYNYRRSDLRTVELLRRYSNRFSICVHGCDHTGGEFASLDEAWLVGTTISALERMESHTNRTQMPFDNVMVFPQGRFSTKAIRALKASGLAAALNSTPWPVDYRENPLTVRDLLAVAVTRYESFPIFVRRNPRDVFDYAFDALFQKPVLAVEHHGFFRNGYEGLAKLVREVSSLSSKVVWMPLGRTVTSSCVLKRMGDYQFTLRHFSPVLRFRNPILANISLLVEKPEQDGLVEAVVVGGQRVAFEVSSGFLKYSVSLRSGEELNVVILYRQIQKASQRQSWRYCFAVSVRRLLSEFRDNHLARSEGLLSFVEKIKGVLASRKMS